MSDFPAWLVAELRAAGCVFAEDEAAVLWGEAGARAGARASDAEVAAALRPLVARRVAGEHLEHIVGWVDFGGLRLSVGPGVFVPRQRTLLLTRVAAGLVAERQTGGARGPVVEAFCGVAPIAASLARGFAGLEVHACDVSPVAVAYASRNLSPEAVHVGRGLTGLPWRLRGHVDVLAAVPPYVPDGEAAYLPHDVLAHEPPGALLAGADGLDAIGSLFGEARDWLAPGAAVAVEMNHSQVGGASRLAAAAGFREVARHREDQTAVLVAGL